MSKPNNEPLAEDILRLADSLADDNATNDDELRRQLQESGIDPDALRARFHRSATRIAKREQVARRSVPLALQQAIEATRPADSPEDQFEDQSEHRSQDRRPLARPALVASPISVQSRNRPCLPQEQPACEIRSAGTRPAGIRAEGESKRRQIRTWTWWPW